MAIPNLILVVGEHEVTLDLDAKAGRILEFALCQCGFHFLAAQFVGEDFFAVKPVFDVIALNDEPRLIPFADGF